MARGAVFGRLDCPMIESIIGDGHQPNSSSWYTHYKGFYSRWDESILNIGSLDHPRHMSSTGVFAKDCDKAAVVVHRMNEERWKTFERCMFSHGPIPFMGLVYSPTFIIKINQM